VPITPAPLSIIELQIGNPVFKLNNQALLLDSPPVIKNDRTLLPIRAVVEAMGGQVNWNAEERRVDIEYRGKTVTLWIGKNTAKVNGKEVMIDPSNPNVVPEIINGRTMLPLRFVAESLGCQLPTTLVVGLQLEAASGSTDGDPSASVYLETLAEIGCGDFVFRNSFTINFIFLVRQTAFKFSINIFFAKNWINGFNSQDAKGYGQLTNFCFR